MEASGKATLLIMVFIASVGEGRWVPPLIVVLIASCQQTRQAESRQKRVVRARCGRFQPPERRHC